MKNIFQDIPSELSEELFQTLASSSQVKIERIVSQGHTSPSDYWYDQDWHEWVILLEGEARLQFADQATEETLHPGDYRLIPAHAKHRVTYTVKKAHTVWLAVHFAA